MLHVLSPEKTKKGAKKVQIKPNANKNDTTTTNNGFSLITMLSWDIITTHCSILYGSLLSTILIKPLRLISRISDSFLCDT